MKLRIKLLLAFGSLIVLAASLLAVFLSTQHRINELQESADSLNTVNTAVLNMDRNIKEFLFEGFKDESFQKTGKSSYVDSARANLESVRKIVHMDFRVQSSESIAKIQETINQLQKDMDTIQALYLKRGFKDFGLEGQLRKAIHSVENSEATVDKVQMLMLRRHEKDFFLRKDLKYRDEFNQRISKVETELAADQTVALKLLQEYESTFNRVVRIEQEIGLTAKTGYRNEIVIKASTLLEAVSIYHRKMKSYIKDFEARSSWLMSILFFIQLVVGITLALIYADIMTRAIKELQRSIRGIAEGEFPPALKVRSEDELGKTKIAFNQLLERLKAATNFAQSLGTGNLSTRYDERFSTDILARSMVTMQQQLKGASEQQRIVNWTNQGLAALNDILKNELEEIAVLGDKIMLMLCKYLDANQGALFIVSQREGRDVLERIATYAYDKKKFLTDYVELGQGLVGECFQQMSEIILKQVPSQYVKITSGLGEATPRFVGIFPLVIQGKAMGVIEFASFRVFDEHEIEFVKKISENIATILNNKSSALETKRLLHLAKEREHKLAQSEEELRQNAEEMQAVQEQMQRQQRDLEEEVAAVRLQLSKFAKGSHIQASESTSLYN